MATPAPAGAPTVGERPNRKGAAPAEASYAKGASVGRYVILDTLGAGGMGVVYDAFDPDLNRRVAIKQLLTAGNDQGQQTRLMREAQALARISHPNVVPVYDVGLHGGTVFIAMERVEGDTLRAWLKGGKRPWREVVRTFAEAGKGLAAAHAARLVHRDFKPANVLIGKDGRVRVMDFGVARDEGDEVVPQKNARLPANTEKTPEVWSESLTEEGSIIGTLGYLSPEQLRSEPATAQSDQFAFCVSLYEALFGQHPYGPKSDGARARMAAVMQGKRLPVPAGSGVPRWLKAAVLKGLETEGAQRHASMDALVHELERRLVRSPRMWTTLAVGVVVAAAAGGVLVSRARTRAECSAGQQRLSGVWDVEARRGVTEAFEGAGQLAGSSVATRVSAALDSYTRKWAEAHDDVCAATRLRGEFSDEVLALRLSCLDRRLGEVKALVSVFKQADKKVLSDAVDAAWGLEDLDGCLDVAALQSKVALPTDSANRTVVEGVFARLAEVRALQETGQEKKARPLVEALAKDEATKQWPTVRAEVSEALATLLRHEGDLPGARAALEEALYQSEVAGADGMAARASIRLSFLLGSQQAKLDEAESWQRHARALLVRSQGEAAANARLGASTGSLLVARGKYEEARPHLEAALARQLSRNGERSMATAAAHNNLGAALARLGRHEEAFTHYRAALATWRELRGPEHTSVATAMHNLALLYGYLGRYQEAEAEIRGALAIQRAAYGDGHRRVATSTQVLAMQLTAQGRCDEALVLQNEALARLEKEMDGVHPRALAARAGVAECLRRVGKVKEALPPLLSALTLARSEASKEPLPLAQVLVAAAGLHLAAGHPAQALPLAKEVVATLEANPSDVVLLARARFLAAQALRASGGDAALAEGLAKAAGEAVSAKTVEEGVLRGDIAAFLAAPAATPKVQPRPKRR